MYGIEYAVIKIPKYLNITLFTGLHTQYIFDTYATIVLTLLLSTMVLKAARANLPFSRLYLMHRLCG